MGSKTPPSDRVPIGQPLEDEGATPPAHADGRTSNPLLQRIAGALQVPPAALYDLPNAVDMKSDGGIEDDCALLLQAYRRITNPDERRRLLMVVQEAAEWSSLP